MRCCKFIQLRRLFHSRVRVKPGDDCGVDVLAVDDSEERLEQFAAEYEERYRAALLAGRIFDDCGNRMTPTHTNKRGARYRYYVSHVILQKRGEEAGSVSRVPAADIEAAVVKAARKHLGAIDIGEGRVPADDRDLIELHLERVIILAFSICNFLK